MYRTPRLLTPLFLILIGAAAAACSGPGARTMMVDGIEHVMNPAEPLRPDLAVTVTKDLEIGQEDGDDMYLIPGIAGLTVGPDETIYALMQGEDQIRVYLPDGTFDHTIGRQGQGPGELLIAQTIAMGGDGNLWVSNVQNLRMTIFTPSGEHLRDIMFTGAPPLFVQTTPTGFMGLKVTPKPTGQPGVVDLSYALQKFSGEGDSLTTLFTNSIQMDVRDLQLGGMQQVIPFYTQDGEGRIWQTRARSDAFEINVYTPEGALDQVVEKEFRPLQKSEQEIADEKEMVRRLISQQAGGQLPEGVNIGYEPEPNRPATGLPYWDPRGYIWVQAGRAETTDMNAFDLFDPKGTYVQQVVFEGIENPGFLTFVGDHVYLFESSPDAIPQIFRYLVKIGD